MFFLLPAREITNSTVNDFKSSLSQHNELNYYTVPLCNYKRPHSSDKTQDDALGSKNIKKSNPAIKSKPITQPPLIDEEDSLKCKLCDWNYPKSFAQQDKDSHYGRCKDGYGETDKKLWSKCKSDRALFRKKIEAREETRNKGIGSEKEKERERDRERDKDREEKLKKERKREYEQGLEIEKKKEEEKQKKSNKEKPITMEIESSENSDFDAPIPKKSHHLKRHDPSTQSQFIEVYDLERDDLKKVKKSPVIIPSPQVTKMIGRKSATKAAFNPSSSSNIVYTID